MKNGETLHFGTDNELKKREQKLKKVHKIIWKIKFLVIVLFLRVIARCQNEEAVEWLASRDFPKLFSWGGVPVSHTQALSSGFIPTN